MSSKVDSSSFCLQFKSAAHLSLDKTNRIPSEKYAKCSSLKGRSISALNFILSGVQLIVSPLIVVGGVVAAVACVLFSAVKIKRGDAVQTNSCGEKSGRLFAKSLMFPVQHFIKMGRGFGGIFHPKAFFSPIRQEDPPKDDPLREDPSRKDPSNDPEKPKVPDPAQSAPTKDETTTHPTYPNLINLSELIKSSATEDQKIILENVMEKVNEGLTNQDPDAVKVAGYLDRIGSLYSNRSNIRVYNYMSALLLLARICSQGDLKSILNSKYVILLHSLFLTTTDDQIPIYELINNQRAGSDNFAKMLGCSENPEEEKLKIEINQDLDKIGTFFAEENCLLDKDKTEILTVLSGLAFELRCLIAKKCQEIVSELQSAKA